MAKVRSENKDAFVAFKARKRKNKWKQLPKAADSDRDHDSDASAAKAVDAKPLLCPHCEYATVCSGRMNAHLVCHSDKRPFRCTYDKCGQAFKRQNSLQRHYKALHLKERLFECAICHKKFSQNQSLQDHVFIHCDLKSFQCPIDDCPKAFQTPKYLKAHLNRRHTDIENDQTEVKRVAKCLDKMKTQAMDKLKRAMKKMREKSGLSNNTNINNLSPIEPFKCEVNECAYSCRLWRSLRSHYKHEHSDLYNPKTKSIDLDTKVEDKALVQNDEEETKNVKKFESDEEVSATKCQTIECHDMNKSVEIEVSADDGIEENDDHDEDTCDDPDSQVLCKSDSMALDKMACNAFFFECNFLKCNYRTKSFHKIAEHFAIHWQQNGFHCN